MVPASLRKHVYSNSHPEIISILMAFLFQPSSSQSSSLLSLSIFSGMIVLSLLSSRILVCPFFSISISGVSDIATVDLKAAVLILKDRVVKQASVMESEVQSSEDNSEKQVILTIVVVYDND